MNRPGKIIGVGRSYREHAKELGNEVPADPLLFFKPPSSVIPSGAPIMLLKASRQVDFEVEIGVVIGRTVRRISDAQAHEAIAGIIYVNDVTARDLQRTDGQWTRAKGFDTFCPIGAEPVTVSDFASLGVVTRVNGIERQRARAVDMVWSITQLVSFISQIMTLEPGDLIATGTPAGVGPLAPGDVVEVEIPGVSSVSNPVMADS